MDNFVVTDPIDGVDNILSFLILRWTTKDKIDLCLNIDANQTDIIKS